MPKYYINILFLNIRLFSLIHTIFHLSLSIIEASPSFSHLPHSFQRRFQGIFCGEIGMVWWFAAACSWVSNVVCSSKIDMGMVMDLVVGFSIFAVRGGGDG